MPKRLLALNLVLVAIAVVFSVQLVRIFSTKRPFPPILVLPAVQVVAAPKETPAPPRPSLVVYGMVATRSLFSPTRSEVVAQGPLAPSARPVLHGVVINEGFRVAYLEDPVTKRVFGYKIGDTVGGGQLDQIEADRVVIKRAEGLLEVKLKDPSKPKPVVSVPKPPSAPGVPSSVPPVGPRRPPPSLPGSVGEPGVPAPRP